MYDLRNNVYNLRVRSLYVPNDIKITGIKKLLNIIYLKRLIKEVYWLLYSLYPILLMMNSHLTSYVHSTQQAFISTQQCQLDNCKDYNNQ